jgi:Putative addiction module component
MTRAIEAIFKKALNLPMENKADLVELLLNSILEEDRATLKETDAAWAKEAKDRFDAFLRGAIPAEPMDDVMASLRKRRAS